MEKAQSLPTVPAPFQFQDKPIRAQLQDDTLWFVARDVCEALNISWSGQTLASLPQEWKGMISYINSQGNQRLRAITEPAVYKLAFRSNKPEADAFTNWVASEVIPAIRKTGKYEAPAPVPTITTAQRAELKALADAKLSACPSDRQGKARGELWSRFNRHFEIPEYAQLPASRMADARDYIIELELKAMQQPAQTPITSGQGCLVGPNPLEALIQLGAMPYDPSPISHLYPEDRELDGMFKTLRGLELKLDSMHRNKQLPPIPRGQDGNSQKLRETFLASCYVARRALGTMFEMGREARRERKALTA